MKPISFPEQVFPRLITSFGMEDLEFYERALKAHPELNGILYLKGFQLWVNELVDLESFWKTFNDLKNSTTT